MLLLVLPALASLPTPDALRAIPDARTHRVALLHGPRGAPAPEAAAPPATVDGSGFDVRDTVLRVRIDTDARTVAGHATFVVDRVATGDLVLHADGPVIASLTVDGQPAAWSPAGDELHVPIDGDVATVDVTWTWSGVSARDGGLQWGDPTFSFHEPDAARRWLVVRDVPSDKTTLRWEITAPDDRVVAANGVLADVAPADAGLQTWTFDFDLPIATYLMAVHLGDYTVLDLTNGGSIPVTAWVYPGAEAEAAETFATTTDMLVHFSALYTPYPWPSYGNAMAPFGGAMEHTTVTTFSDELVGDDFGEIVNAHELGHHWWGDSVTLGTWADIWLNEGFASYTEALWYERYYGQEGLTAYVSYQADSYLRWRDYEGTFSLYDPDYLWGGTVYDKGSFVVHMLRGVLGDEVFFQALRDYEARHHLGTAVTTDFIASVEETSRQDLAWFFDPWLYTAGEPIYTWSWAAQPYDGGYQVDVVVAQDRTEFAMPVPFRVTLADGTTVDDVVEVAGEAGMRTLCVASEPTDVAMDPDQWVLTTRTDEVAGTPGDVRCGREDTGEPDSGAPDTGADPDDGAADDEDVGGAGGCGCASGGVPGPAHFVVAAGALALARRPRDRRCRWVQGAPVAARTNRRARP